MGQRARSLDGHSFKVFQSLFFWNGLWDNSRAGRGATNPLRFNPCFSGMAFGTPFIAGPPVPCTSVSILVFLEWPLGRERPDHLLSTRRRFQSLFFWNGLWDSAPGDTEAVLHKLFQSLFFWNGLWDPGLIPVAMIQGNEFQSLFFWNGLWDRGPVTMSEVKQMKFQSLFFWNGLWDAEWSHYRARRYDVSILVFLEWPLGRCTSVVGSPAATQFQSLFFWNGLWDKQFLTSRRISGTGFNPCFSGMAFGTSRGNLQGENDEEVSILVFLEWPLGLRAGDVYHCHPRGFNPCFSGMAFGTDPASSMAYFSRFATFFQAFFFNKFFSNFRRKHILFCLLFIP